MDNRNIYGFVFFTLIVISTVFINYIFFQPAAVQVEPPKSYTRTECFTKSKRVTEPVVVRQRVQQATLDLNSGLLHLNFNLSKQVNFEPTHGVAVVLDFYTKDSHPRKVGREVITVKADDLENIRLTCSFAWVSKLHRHQSLYVVPNVAPSRYEAKNIAVEFDDADAVPVLLFSGNIAK